MHFGQVSTRNFNAFERPGPKLISKIYNKIQFAIVFLAACGGLPDRVFWLGACGGLQIQSSTFVWRLHVFSLGACGGLQIHRYLFAACGGLRVCVFCFEVCGGLQLQVHFCRRLRRAAKLCSWRLRRADDSWILVFFRRLRRALGSCILLGLLRRASDSLKHLRKL